MDLCLFLMTVCVFYTSHIFVQDTERVLKLSL